MNMDIGDYDPTLYSVGATEVLKTFASSFKERANEEMVSVSYIAHLIFYESPAIIH